MSHFVPSPQAERVLRTGRIIDPDESPAHMVERVTRVRARQESEFSGQQAGAQFAESLEAALDNKDIIMSTPVMTNAGRFTERPLTACTVPTTDFDPVRSRHWGSLSPVVQRNLHDYKVGDLVVDELADLIASDGDELDAYYLGEQVPLLRAVGTVIAIVNRLDDDKLVVVPQGADAVTAAIEFQEIPGQYIIVRA